MISLVSSRTRKRWLMQAAFACAAILAVACSKEDSLVAPSESVSLPPPSFNATTPPNGPGACLGADAVAGNITSGLAVPGDGSDLNCTSNDVDISQAVITEYRVGAPPAGPFIPLPPGGTIDCLTGETIEAKTQLLIQNNAQARYDVGTWINPDPDEADPTGNGLGAQLGSSCLHFNLVNGDGGSTSLDDTPDDCGDVAAGGLLTIDLETLSFACADVDGNGTVDIDACAAWHNSTTGAGEIVCPLDPPGDVPTGYRYGTGPETKAKCRCEGLNLPISIKSVLRVTKVTNPSPDPTEPDQEFAFTPTGYGAPFSLSNGETNSSGPIDAGTYSVAETVPAGWDLTNLGSIVCVNTSDSSAHAHTVTSNSVEVELGPGEDVTCTFTNALIPTLKLTKLLDPTTDGGKFDLKIDTVVCLADAGHNDSCGPQEVTVGSHTVSEAAGTSTDLADYNSVVGGDCAPNGSVTVAIGDAKECTITNTLKRGVIKITKVTDPAGGTNFGFTDDIEAPNNFSLDDGQTKTFDPVLPGQYMVTEDDPTPGFDLTSLSCDDGASDTPSTTSLVTRKATINVDPGETVECTFTNTQRGTIKITKITDPTGGTGFGYTDDIEAPNSFSLDHGQTKTFSNVVPGSYMATEDDPTPGFDLTGLSCDDGASDTPSTTSLVTRKASVELDPGETVECTFTNTQRGTIKITKITDPTGGTGFGYTDDIEAPNSFSLDHGQTKTFSNVVPGSYMATEDDPTPGFDLTGLSCDDGASDTPSTTSLVTRKASVELDPGETVECTFTNTQRAMVTLNKRESGGLPLSTAYQFEIRQGANLISSGTTLATGSADLVTGVVDFSCVLAVDPDICQDDASSMAKLVPGDYQICEVAMMPGFSNNIDGFTPNGEPAEGADNSSECVDVTLNAGDSGAPTIPLVLLDPIDNSPPPGGDARTIGFWKNWTSCDGHGNQDDVLDQTLVLAGGGIQIGDLFVDNCEDAVSVLDKRDINTGKKRANDACYGLAAQLLAAELNVVAGAGVCAASTTAIADAQQLLDDNNYDGTGQCLRPRDADYAEARSLAETLDNYNNNTLCP